MKCPVCNTENVDTAKFCCSCGGALSGTDEYQAPNEQPMADEYQEPNATYPNAEDSTVKNKKTKKKASSNGEKKKSKVWLWILLGIILLAGIGATVFFVIYNKPINKWKRFVDAQSYSEATECVIDNLDSFSEDDADLIKDTTLDLMDGVYEDYMNEELEYSVAKSQIEDFARIEYVNANANAMLYTMELVENSRIEFDRGETSLANGDYLGAIEHYYNVDSSDEKKYEKSKERREECLQLYTEQILKEADELISANKYEEALNVVREAILLVGYFDELTQKENEIQELISQTEAKNLLSQAKLLKNSGKTEEALKLLADYTGYDSDIISLRSQLEEVYEKEVDAYVRKAIEEGDVDGAKAKLEDAKKLLPYSATLSNWMNEIEDYYPVKLTELHIFKEESDGNMYDNELWRPEKDKDNLENSDYFGFRYNVASTREVWRSRTFVIDGKYNIFSGIWATNEISKDKTDANKGVYMDVYGDGELLYTSPVTRGGVYPYEFEVDITGVQELTVTVRGTGSIYFAILNPELKKTTPQ